MFNYLFPIFCFGLVICGIVFLGMVEAAKQATSQALVERTRDNPDKKAGLDRERAARKTALPV